MTPSRALRTIGERVDSTLGEPSLLGIRSLTAMAQEACGFGTPTTSIRHMRQLPAIDSRSWKQKRGISAPAASHACSSVYSGGTSISLPSMMSLVIGSGLSMRYVGQFETFLDPVDAKLQPVKSTIYAGPAFFHCHHANLQVLQIFCHPFGPLVDLA